jgi:hypothetical protein
MKFKSMQAIAAGAKNLGFDEEDFSTRDDYSGRGMYGKETCAVICTELGAFLSVVAAATAMLAEEHGSSSGPVEEFIEDMRHVSVDSMGRDSLIYY